MSTVIDLFQRMSESRHWIGDENLVVDDLVARETERNTWNLIMNQLRGAVDIVSEVLNDGLQHAGLALEILPRPKSSTKKGVSLELDIEAKGESVKPGELGFAQSLDKKLKTFHDRKSQIFRVWASEKGFSSILNIGEVSDGETIKPKTMVVKDLAQLYILLFLEKMVSTSCICSDHITSSLADRSKMHSAVTGVQDLVSLADDRVANGKMKKNRLILPPSQMVKSAIKG
jgi:hypothetical protein